MPVRSLLPLFGAALTTVSAVLFLVFFALDLAGFHTNPYFGIVTFLLLPATFVAGLLLIPFSLWRARRRQAQGLPVRQWPVLNFAHAGVRWTAIVILALTGVNIAIVAMAAAKAVEYSDSTDFCTGVCHTPMEPEAVAHLGTLHASVSCAACHVGPGAAGFIEREAGRHSAAAGGRHWHRVAADPGPRARSSRDRGHLLQLSHTQRISATR